VPQQRAPVPQLAAHPVDPEHQPYSPFPQAGVGSAPVAVAAARSKLPLFVIAGVAGVVLVIAIALAVTAGGGSGGAGSREALVTEAVEALSAGDFARLVELADVDQAFESAMECDSSGGDTYGLSQLKKTKRDEMKRKMQRRVDDLRGARLEYVDVKAKRRYDDDYDDKSRVFKKGSRVKAGCTAKQDLEIHDLQVRVKVTEKGAKEGFEQAMRMEVLQVGDRYYLGKISTIELGSPAVTKMVELADRMCECKDRLCAEGVNDDYTKWGVDMARKGNREPTPSPEAMKRLTEAATRYTECYTRLGSRY
jgi:hypothetical protein